MEQHKEDLALKLQSLQQRLIAGGEAVSKLEQKREEERQKAAAQIEVILRTCDYACTRLDAHCNPTHGSTHAYTLPHTSMLSA